MFQAEFRTLFFYRFPTQVGVIQLKRLRLGSILMSHESGLTPHDKVLIPHENG